MCLFRQLTFGQETFHLHGSFGICVSLHRYSGRSETWTFFLHGHFDVMNLRHKDFWGKGHYSTVKFPHHGHFGKGKTEQVHKLFVQVGHEITYAAKYRKSSFFHYTMSSSDLPKLLKTSVKPGVHSV